MRESRTYGFVRGVPGDWHPYRDRLNRPMPGVKWLGVARIRYSFPVEIGVCASGGSSN